MSENIYEFSSQDLEYTEREDSLFCFSLFLCKVRYTRKGLVDIVENFSKETSQRYSFVKLSLVYKYTS
jgi:hypothetical protein